MTATMRLSTESIGTGEPVTLQADSGPPTWSLQSETGLRVQDPAMIVDSPQYHLTREQDRAVLKALWSSVERDDFVGM